MTNTMIVEYDRKQCSVRILSDTEAALHYDDKVLKLLHEDGHAFVSNDVEIHFEGCYHPTIVLTLDK